MTQEHSTRDAASAKPAWSAVGAMTLCVALLIASEFMPVSLLTPIANDLHATEGMAGQAISISGLFAVLTSLCIPAIASRLDRRHVLAAMTAFMLASLVLIAAAPSFAILMVARALLGITIGGFWSLATATVMRLVPPESVSRALGVMYTGNAAATAVAAPVGSYLGSIIGWRGVFWCLVPMAAASLVWQWVSLPPMRSHGAQPVTKVMGLLKRRKVAVAIAAVMLAFAGAFASFTYFRPFLQSYAHVTLPQLSLLLLAFGAAGFVGTSGATALLGRHLDRLLHGLPLGLAIVTLTTLAIGHFIWPLALALVAWGALNAAIPVAWFNWLAQQVSDEPEAAGGLMVAAIQLAIMVGASLGGFLLDHLSISATFIAGALLLVLSSVTFSVGRSTARPRIRGIAPGLPCQEFCSNPSRGPGA